MLASFKKGYPRLTNHLGLGLFTLVGCGVALLLAAPTQSALEALSVGTGYIGLILIGVSLIIGPINMLKARKNPVNLMFRRDTGIWAGITSLIHVGLAFALELNWGGTLLGFFLNKDGSLKLNLFGLSNFVGLIGTLVIIFLLVLSNNYFLKRLKGKRWKALQRFNYLLFGAAFIHTFTQQINNTRGIFLIVVALAGTLLVLAGQGIGFVIYRQRAGLRKAAEPAVRPFSATATVQAYNPTNPYLSVSPVTSSERFRPVRGPVVESRSFSQPAPTNDLSNRQMAAAFGITAIMGIIVGFLGINVLNNQATTSSVAPNSATSSQEITTQGNSPNQSVVGGSNNNSNNNSNSGIGSNFGNGNNSANSSIGSSPSRRGRTSINQPSTGSGSVHTGGS